MRCGLCSFLCSYLVTAQIPGVFLPHGDFAFDPTLAPLSPLGARDAAVKVARGSRQAARAFERHQHMDTILLITPHGMQLDHDFGIYMAKSGQGYATLGQDLIPPRPSYNVSIDHLPMNFAASQDLLDAMKNHHHQNISGIYPPNEESPMPLNWGEILPLKILMEMAGDDSSWNNETSVMILSLPHRRYDRAQEMVPELLRLGCLIGAWIQNLQPWSNIGVVISGDLSHTHLSSGPYGYSSASAPYDEAMGRWASNPNQNVDQLIHIAANFQPQALSCGFTGYVLWQGIYQQSQSNDETLETCLNSFHPILGGVDTESEATATIRKRRATAMLADTTTQKLANTRNVDGPHAAARARLYVNLNVTYYGMMAATFL